MLRTIEKLGMISIERIWFQKKVEKVEANSLILRYMRVENVPRRLSKGADVSLTLWSDLTLDEEQLLLAMRKQVRYEIRRAEKENITFEIWDSNERKINSVLEEFHSVYNNFCKVAGYYDIINDFNEKRIVSYAEYKCVTITIAKFENGAVYHLYVHDENVALLMYSASDFRNENVDSNLAGRANKLLHYKDMLTFKNRGIGIYDWGNVSSFEEPNGIDNFKLGFGGKKKIVYNVYDSDNIIGQVLIFMRKKMSKNK